MQFVNDDPLYKIARVTGPKHNFLGLEFTDQASVEALKVERLNVSRHEKENFSDRDVIEQVLLGLADASVLCERAYRLRKIQYVPSDSAPVEVYRFLTVEIIRRIERTTE
jgi:hypothetical protein